MAGGKVLLRGGKRMIRGGKVRLGGHGDDCCCGDNTGGCGPCTRECWGTGLFGFDCGCGPCSVRLAVSGVTLQCDNPAVCAGGLPTKDDSVYGGGCAVNGGGIAGTTQYSVSDPTFGSGNTYAAFDCTGAANPFSPTGGSASAIFYIDPTTGHGAVRAVSGAGTNQFSGLKIHPTGLWKFADFPITVPSDGVVCNAGGGSGGQMVISLECCGACVATHDCPTDCTACGDPLTVTISGGTDVDGTYSWSKLGGATACAWTDAGAIGSLQCSGTTWTLFFDIGVGCSITATATNTGTCPTGLTWTVTANSCHGTPVITVT